MSDKRKWLYFEGTVTFKSAVPLGDNPTPEIEAQAVEIAKTTAWQQIAATTDSFPGESRWVIVDEDENGKPVAPDGWDA